MIMELCSCITCFFECMYLSRRIMIVFFFFQAEDGIRDLTVTRVQTCALPILIGGRPLALSIWSIEAQGVIASREVEYGGSGVDVAFSPTGAIALVEQGHAVGLTSQLQELWQLDLPYQCFAEFSASGRRVALGSWERGLVAGLTV